MQWSLMGTSKPTSRKRVRPRRRQQNCLRDTQCCKSKSTMRRRRFELKGEPETKKSLRNQNGGAYNLSVPALTSTKPSKLNFSYLARLGKIDDGCSLVAQVT